MKHAICKISFMKHDDDKVDVEDEDMRRGIADRKESELFLYNHIYCYSAMLAVTNKN